MGWGVLKEGAWGGGMGRGKGPASQQVDNETLLSS